MATDYLLELPYNKLQFFLVVFLALAASGDERPRSESTTRRGRGVVAVAVALSVVAVLQIYYHASLTRKIHAAAAMERIYLRTAEQPGNAADLNVDGVVDGLDLGLLLGSWTHH